VVEEARFDSAYTFQYSPRPGTAASSWTDQVPKEVVQERFDRLVALQESIALQRNREYEGRTVEVLVEGTGRKGGIQGRTRTNKIAHFDADVGAGEFVDVVVERAHPHHLTARVARPAAVPA
jgi:tRNA-2-methylthio-N6-dimethylallyladenosine synthase